MPKESAKRAIVQQSSEHADCPSIIRLYSYILMYVSSFLDCAIFVIAGGWELVTKLPFWHYDPWPRLSPLLPSRFVAAVSAQRNLPMAVAAMTTVTPLRL